VTSDDWAQEDEEEYQPLSIPPEFRSLLVDEQTVPIREIWQRYLSQELVLEPDFQRHYVWDPIRASRYIESLILRLPTPPIFLSQEKGQWVVIDGHQRLETLFRFMQPLLSGPAQAAGRGTNRFTVLPPLTLTSLKIIPELNGKGVTALSMEDRARLWDTKISVISLPEGNHPEMKYELFARLNLGSMSLNSQELRNCLYRGSYNRIIAQLSEGPHFLQLWRRNSPDKRMKHRELVLRFFAFLHRRGSYRPPFREFLNEEMRERKEASAEELARFQREFSLGMEWTSKIFASEAFRLFRMSSAPGTWAARRNDLLYEVETVTLATFGETLESIWKGLSATDQQILRMMVRRKLIDVMTNQRFLDTINQATTGPLAVDTRFSMFGAAMEAICHNPSAAIDEGRKLHEALAKSNVCSLCPNQVSPDDAEWSVPQQKVAHRFCRRESLR
jgi:hypothetical protein